MVKDEELQKYHEKATLQQVLKGGKKGGQNSIAQEILAQDQYKQEIIDGLLGVRRVKKPMETEDGQLYLQEFVRLEDQSGRWLKLDDLSDQQWREIKSNGRIEEEGAKAVLTTLNGIANNNVSMSNLTQKQINKIGEQAVRSIDNKLRSHRQEYGIDSTEDLEWIMTNIINPNVMGGLNKAKNGKFIKELLSQTNLVGSLDDEEEDGNGGLIASFKN